MESHPPILSNLKTKSKENFAGPTIFSETTPWRFSRELWHGLVWSSQHYVIKQLTSVKAGPWTTNPGHILGLTGSTGLLDFQNQI